ncbi:transcriptional regulator [Cupriavidus sp. USMAA2-4]|uniref:Transcriptional regulator n=1 Tax=Cupriavidus malaysiensis TaxID=367825 RepID=A0A1D9IBD3_9BURK|nr:MULTISPECIES: transcriptional regulator [Cupriavidus]AOY96253.1 transcriptional regulator [Cupriavidus sp. USMAA2-4]AOZ03342.1 transcriptional regulator [Cupriavidus sp. USMAHM13]AOZ09295.1 transcriptional regulator [Cupriavidus malaysiensis]
MEARDKTVFTAEQLDAYFASYVGMEGGDPAAPVWFCDATPHTWAEALAAPLVPRAEPTAWDSDFRARHHDVMQRWQSHQKIARIMASARAEVFRRPQSECDWQHYFDTHLFAPGGAEFKMSLFPLPANHIGSVPWSQAFRGQPALVPKRRYLDLCRNGGRFRFVADTRRRWKPKLVVCFGERHREDFVQAFGLGHVHASEHVLQPADQAKTLYMVEHDNTTWIMCAALAGAAGMTSDVLLDALGAFIAPWLEQADFARCGGHCGRAAAVSPQRRLPESSWLGALRAA